MFNKVIRSLGFSKIFPVSTKSQMLKYEKAELQRLLKNDFTAVCLYMFGWSGFIYTRYNVSLFSVVVVFLPCVRVLLAIANEIINNFLEILQA